MQIRFQTVQLTPHKKSLEGHILHLGNKVYEICAILCKDTGFIISLSRINDIIILYRFSWTEWYFDNQNSNKFLHQNKCKNHNCIWKLCLPSTHEKNGLPAGRYSGTYRLWVPWATIGVFISRGHIPRLICCWPGSGLCCTRPLKRNSVCFS